MAFPVGTLMHAKLRDVDTPHKLHNIDGVDMSGARADISAIYRFRNWIDPGYSAVASHLIEVSINSARFVTDHNFGTLTMGSLADDESWSIKYTVDIRPDVAGTTQTAWHRLLEDGVERIVFSNTGGTYFTRSGAFSTKKASATYVSQQRCSVPRESRARNRYIDKRKFSIKLAA